MSPIPARKCLCCQEKFHPDARNRRHQQYCSKDDCRKASKAARQARWLAKPEIRRGWYLGKDSFKDKLLRMLEKTPRRGSGGSRRAEGVERERGEKEALRILKEGSGLLGLPLSKADLAALRKSDSRKVQIAILMRTHTSVSNEWIAQKLAMGHPGSVSRSVSDGRADSKMTKLIKNIEGMLIRVL